MNIYIDASNLPFAKLVKWAQKHDYECKQDNGRIYFEHKPQYPIPAEKIEKILDHE